MEYEHWVELEQAGCALPRLSREEVWFGLLCRAEDPCQFLPGLESMEVRARGPGWMERALNFGSVVVLDRVEFIELESMVFCSAQTAQHPGGKLSIHIEDGEEESSGLRLRFHYHTTLVCDGSDARFAGFIESAYRQSDLDTVRKIREIAALERPRNSP